MTITLPENCGNSPKQEFLKTLSIHLAAHNTAELMPCLDEAFTWTSAAESNVLGKSEFMDLHELLMDNPATELILHSIITHGKEGAVKGEVKLQKGKHYRFADFYTFSNAKGDCVLRMESFVVEKPKAQSPEPN